MNSKIESLEKKIEDMKNIFDVEKLVEAHNDISKQLIDVKQQIIDTEIYVKSICNITDEEDANVMFRDSDASDDSDEFSDKDNLLYDNSKYLRDIEELKNIELHIGRQDIDMEDLIDLYEKSLIIAQDITEYLENQKMHIININ